MADEGLRALVSVCAYRVVARGIIDEASYVDLMPHVQGSAIDWAPDVPGT